MNRMAYGMSEFIPIITDKHFFAISNCSVHSTLIDYRFRVSSTMQNKVYGAKMLYQESGIQVKSQKKAKKGKKGKTQEEIGAEEGELDLDYNHWVPKSAAEFLFCDEFGKMALEIDAEDADYLYNEYTNIIKTLFKKLAKNYNAFVKNTVKDQEALKKKSIPLVAPKLTPPGTYGKTPKKESENPETAHENPEETKIDDTAINQSIINTEAGSTSELDDEEIKITEGDEEAIPTVRRSNIIESNKDVFEEEYEKVVKVNQNFSKRVNLKNPGEVATKLLMEVNEYSCQLFSLWNEYIQLLMLDQTATVEYFRPVYQKLIYERW